MTLTSWSFAQTLPAPRVLVASTPAQLRMFATLQAVAVPNTTIVLGADITLTPQNGGAVFIAGKGTTLDGAGHTIRSTCFFDGIRNATFNGYQAHGPIVVIPQFGPAVKLQSIPNLVFCNPPGNLKPIVGKDAEEPAPLEYFGPYTMTKQVLIPAENITIKNLTIEQNAPAPAYCILDIRQAKNITLTNVKRARTGAGSGIFQIAGCDGGTIAGCDAYAIQLNSTHKMRVSNNTAEVSIAVEEDVEDCQFFINIAAHFSSNDMTCARNAIIGNTFTGTPGTGSIQFQGGDGAVICGNTCTLPILLSLNTRNCYVGPGQGLAVDVSGLNHITNGANP